VTASAVGDMSPFLKWTLAVIAGGGAAGLVQGATVMTRAASTATTGGLANPVVSTLELVGATFISILAIIAPIVAVLLLITIMVFVGRKLMKRFRNPSPNLPPSPSLLASTK
jgi:hypothetical protein